MRDLCSTFDTMQEKINSYAIMEGDRYHRKTPPVECDSLDEVDRISRLDVFIKSIPSMDDDEIEEIVLTAERYDFRDRKRIMDARRKRRATEEVQVARRLVECVN